MNNSCVGEVLLNEDQIKNGVSLVANQLNERFSDAVVISVVPGGILFTADLVRQLEFNVEMDYISCPHTPGDRNNRSTIVYHENIKVKDRDVILVDDALESGGTMTRLVAEFIARRYCRSVSVATLLVKPGRVNVGAPEYFAYELASDELLVGYGLPWKDKYRHLPYVSKLNI